MRDKTTMIKKNKGCKPHLLISIQMNKAKKLIKLEKIKHQMKKFSNMRDVSTIEIISIKMITGISILKEDIRKEVATEEIEVGIVVVIEVVIEKTIIETIEMIGMKMIKMKEIIAITTKEEAIIKITEKEAVAVAEVEVDVGVAIIIEEIGMNMFTNTQ